MPGDPTSLLEVALITELKKRHRNSIVSPSSPKPISQVSTFNTPVIGYPIAPLTVGPMVNVLPCLASTQNVLVLATIASSSTFVLVVSSIKPLLTNSFGILFN